MPDKRELASPDSIDTSPKLEKDYLDNLWVKCGLDQETSQQELIALGKLGNESWDEFDASSHTPGFVAFVASRPKEFGRLFNGYTTLIHLQRILREEIGTIPDDNTVKNAARSNNVGIMEFGTRILVYQQLEKLRQFGHTGHFVDPFFTFLDCRQLEYCDVMDVKFGNISFNDILSGRKFPAVDRFLFFMLPWIIAENETADFNSQTTFSEIVAASKGEIRRAFPAFSGYGTMFAAKLIVTMMEVGEINLPTGLALSPEQRQAFEATARLSRGIEQTREELYKVLTNPESSEFQELINSVAAYSKNKNVFVWIAHIFHLFDKKTFTQRYRKVKGIADSPDSIYIAFSLIMERFAVLKNTEELPLPISELVNLLPDYNQEETDDQDLDSQIDESQLRRDRLNHVFESEQARYDWKRLRDLNSAIVNSVQRLKLKTNEHNIDPTSIAPSWTKIERPSKITLNTNPSNPFAKFSIYFSWGDEADEENYDVDLSFNVRAGKEEFEWSFLDSPEIASSQPVRTALVNLSGDVLTCLCQELTTRKIEAVAPKPKGHAEPTTHKPKVEEIHVTDEVYAGRKETRQAKPTTPGFWLSPKDTPAKVLRNLPIDFSETSTLEILLIETQLTPIDCIRIRNALKRYSGENAYGIKRLRVPSREGYTHKARVGRYRIFFTEEEGELVPKVIMLRRDVDYGKI